MNLKSRVTKILLALSVLLGAGIVGVAHAPTAGAVQFCDHWVLPSKWNGWNYDIWACVEDNGSRHITASLPSGIAYEVWGNPPVGGGIDIVTQTSRFWTVTGPHGPDRKWNIQYCSPYNGGNPAHWHKGYWQQGWGWDGYNYAGYQAQFVATNSQDLGPGAPTRPTAWTNRHQFWVNPFLAPLQAGQYSQCIDAYLN